MAPPSHSDASPWADAVLGIFAKRPVPGAVKTRLAQATSPEWAARVADAFLHDTLDRFCHVSGRRVVAFSPATEGRYFAELAAGRFESVPQTDGDLGRRLEAFFRTCMSEGARRVVVIGTDTPTLPVTFATDAFERLRRVDIVIGPATDGGYYLLGCAHRVPPIFHNISWGSPAVLSETVTRLTAIPSNLDTLPPWYDVDTVADWQALQGHVMAMRRSGIDPQVPATERLFV